ncbi:MAG: His/Gly/Thr/Pro-type tRNA ligase C-terminal domain-containing protein, partial [Chitinophagaceae bacterium]
DERNEKIGKKIREAELMKVPYMIVIGEKEAEENKLSVRKRLHGDLGKMNSEQFLTMITEEVESKKMFE